MKFYEIVLGKNWTLRQIGNLVSIGNQLVISTRGIQMFSQHYMHDACMVIPFPNESVSKIQTYSIIITGRIYLLVQPTVYHCSTQSLLVKT